MSGERSKPLRPTPRSVAVISAVVALLFPAASAHGASFFKYDSGGVHLELHVVHRHIAYLNLEVPVTCDSGIGRKTAFSVDGRPIPLGRSGRFSIYDSYEKNGGYRERLHGTILHGVIDAEYEYASWDSFGHNCWSGEQLAEPGPPPQGSPVALSAHRREGLRFYSQGPLSVAWDLRPHIYFWTGGGNVYGLTAHSGLTCRRPGHVLRTYQEWLRPRQPIPIDPETKEFRYRHLLSSQAWKLSARFVGRRVVRGRLSFTSSGSLYCRTGARDGPWVPFQAVRG